MNYDFGGMPPGMGGTPGGRFIFDGFGAYCTGDPGACPLGMGCDGVV